MSQAETYMSGTHIWINMNAQQSWMTIGGLSILLCASVMRHKLKTFTNTLLCRLSPKNAQYKYGKNTTIYKSINTIFNLKL